MNNNNIVEIVGVGKNADKKRSFGLFTSAATEECLKWLVKEWGDEYELVVNPPKEINSLTARDGSSHKWVGDDTESLKEKVVDLTLSLMEANINGNCPYAYYNSSDIPRENDSCEDCDRCKREFFKSARAVIKKDLDKEYPSAE